MLLFVVGFVRVSRGEPMQFVQHFWTRCVELVVTSLTMLRLKSDLPSGA